MLAAIPRTRARDVFVRGFGVVFVAAFVSLLAQVRVLYGARGLLPACRLVDATDWTQTPSLFHLSCGDVALQTGAAAGALLGVVLALGFVPRVCLVACWLLYFSFVSVGQDFLWFQWDNLLLETGFFALFVTPGGRRLRGAPAPPAAGVFLMLWLLIRLQFESGAAKLLLGDPTWRDLTAMATYYETAPLPTWVGWWAHQMPTWAHRASALFTYVVELGLPWLVFGPRPLRLVAFVGMAAMQVSVIATANYGFFNYLSLLLCVWALDDRHLARVGLRPAAASEGPAAGSGLLAVMAIILVPVSVVPFLPFLRPPPALARKLAPVHAFLDITRTMNAYHLFAQMTLVRREVVIEGSADGENWQPYEFRWKPGDPGRAPAFVAPHQPRVDFQLWFLLLGHRHGERYFETLMLRLLTDPTAVAPLFAVDPFPDVPPRLLRVAFYRYHFTDRPTRAATGAWWTRDLEGYSRPLDVGALGLAK